MVYSQKRKTPGDDPALIIFALIIGGVRGIGPDDSYIRISNVQVRHVESLHRFPDHASIAEELI
jgi:hypothetical protein